MSNETYEGWKNHETWAFNLHWANDEGLYNMVREFGADYLKRNDEATDYELGKALIEYVQEGIWAEFGDSEGIKMWREETGSVWRVDEEETGENLRADLS